MDKHTGWASIKRIMPTVTASHSHSMFDEANKTISYFQFMHYTVQLFSAIETEGFIKYL